MVTFPDLDLIQSGDYESNKIYSDFVKNIREELKKSNLAKRPVKRLLKEYYLKVDSFYEKLVRDNHAKNSATEIRNRHELGFIDSALREIVAEVSEAHVFFASTFWRKLKNIFGECCISKLEKVAKPGRQLPCQPHGHCRQYLIVTA